MSFVPPGVALKIERAKTHIGYLDSLAADYLSKRPMRIFIRQDDGAATKSIVIKTDNPIPGVFAAVLGDAIHNLHSALDHLAFHLV